MQIHEYSKAAIRTESKIGEVKGVGAVSLHATLTAVIGVGDVMDQIKKNVFYNRPYDREKLADAIGSSIGALQFLLGSIQPGAEHNFADPAQTFDIHRMTKNDGPTGKNITVGPDALAQLDPRIFHVITGIITEASELAEALQLNLEGDALDLVNVSEEIGDIAWYGFGIFPDASEIPPGQILDTNIGKLVKRYPAKFDGYLAQQENRDLTAEREILEEGAAVLKQEGDAMYLNADHIDNAAIDCMAESMKARMYLARTSEGKGGWAEISEQDLELCLENAINSTSPNRLVNIANYAAMITWVRNAEVNHQAWLAGQVNAAFDKVEACDGKFTPNAEANEQIAAHKANVKAAIADETRPGGVLHNTGK